MSRRIVILSGGIGGARFIRGVQLAEPDAQITVIANTADDLWAFGVRICPDLDSIMYTLGDGIDPERKWGRADETWHAREELAAYGVAEAWFGLGDRDLATHLVRTERLRAGATLTEVTAELCQRWQPGVDLLPMTDDPVETQLDITDEQGARTIHFQEYWIRHRAQVPFTALRYHGADQAHPTDQVRDALAAADQILLAPSNPVVSIRPILAIPGLAAAVREASAPVVGVSPIINGGHVRGMADQLMSGLGLEISAAGVAELYGSRTAEPTRERPGLLDGWLVDTADADQVDRLTAAGIRARAVPLYMSSPEATRQLAADALDLAGDGLVNAGDR